MRVRVRSHLRGTSVSCVPIAQYPQPCTEVVAVGLSQRFSFALKAHSDGNNCQEQHMGCVQLLRGREREGASTKGFCHLCACACVCLLPDQRWYKGHAPPKSEDGWSSEVNRLEFKRQDNKVKCVRVYPALCWPELQDLKKIALMYHGEIRG